MEDFERDLKLLLEKLGKRGNTLTMLRGIFLSSSILSTSLRMERGYRWQAWMCLRISSSSSFTVELHPGQALSFIFLIIIINLYIKSTQNASTPKVTYDILKLSQSLLYHSQTTIKYVYMSSICILSDHQLARGLG